MPLALESSSTVRKAIWFVEVVARLPPTLFVNWMVKMPAELVTAELVERLGMTRKSWLVLTKPDLTMPWLPPAELNLRHWIQMGLVPRTWTPSVRVSPGTAVKLRRGTGLRIRGAVWTVSRADAETIMPDGLEMSTS